MKKITKKIHYFFFKPVELKLIPNVGDYYYIRVQIERCEKHHWCVGYENEIGGVTVITAAEPSTFQLIDLENEYQNQTWVKELKEGKTIGAIKAYKELTGAGLYEAKEFILDLINYEKTQ